MWNKICWRFHFQENRAPSCLVDNRPGRRVRYIFKFIFLVNERYYEKMLLHISHLSSHVEQYPADYFLLFSLELVVFKYTRWSFKLDFFENEESYEKLYLILSSCFSIRTRLITVFVRVIRPHFVYMEKYQTHLRIEWILMSIYTHVCVDSYK